MELPVIDISSLLLADVSENKGLKLITAQQIDSACREVGFFYISNHGVPHNLIKRMISNARTFFETASQEEKDEIRVRRAGEGDGDDARGWHRSYGHEGTRHECIDMFRPVDTMRGPPYEVGLGENQWPRTPPDFEEVSLKYVQHIEELGIKIMKAIALGLNMKENLLLDKIDRAFWNLRILSYEGIEKDEDENMKGMNEHADFGLLTFLLTDPQKESLQVQSKSGHWVSADPLPGCFLCNIGVMLTIWTGGIYNATKHRVQHKSEKMRISIPFFFDPNMDALISPILPGHGKDEKEEAILYREKFIQCVKYSAGS